jgi:hypothetical protein
MTGGTGTEATDGALARQGTVLPGAIMVIRTLTPPAVIIERESGRTNTLVGVDGTRGSGTGIEARGVIQGETMIVEALVGEIGTSLKTVNVEDGETGRGAQALPRRRRSRLQT